MRCVYALPNHDPNVTGGIDCEMGGLPTFASIEQARGMIGAFRVYAVVQVGNEPSAVRDSSQEWPDLTIK